MNAPMTNKIETVTGNLLADVTFENLPGSVTSLCELQAKANTPGVSIAVIDNFNVEWVQGFGVNATGSEAAVTADTMFQAGSISKSVFALAVMRLLREGRLDLDEDVNHYLTSWKVPANNGWKPRVTLRQLLSHTAGTTVHGFHGYNAPESIPSTVQVLNGEPPSNSPPVRVNVMPGLQFRYSGGGTTIAQQVMADITGKSVAAFMRELVLDPLGLNHSTFESPLPNSWDEKIALGHQTNGVTMRGGFNTYPELAAAGLWTTPSDLAKLGLELMRIFNGTNDSVFLSQDMVKAMLHPQLAHQSIGAGYFYGMGFECSGTDESFKFGHSGANHGYLASMAFFPHVGKGLVAMLNSNQGYDLIPSITRTISQEYSWPAEHKEYDAIGVVETGVYEGVYETETGTRIAILGEEAGLKLQIGCQAQLPIYAKSKSAFYAQAVNLSINFEFNESGKASALTLAQSGANFKASRKHSTY